MIKVYDVKEQQYVMVNVSKIIIIYHSLDKKNVLIQVDGLEYPIRTDMSYEVGLYTVGPYIKKRTQNE